MCMEVAATRAWRWPHGGGRYTCIKVAAWRWPLHGHGGGMLNRVAWNRARARGYCMEMATLNRLAQGEQRPHA